MEIQRQQELRRQQEQAEAERKRKADEADQKGLEASDRGDWEGASNWFVEALGFAPDSAEIHEHLDRANLGLADATSAEEMLALRQRIEDSIAAARLRAMRLRLEDQIAVQRFTAMLEHFRSQTEASLGPTPGRADEGTQLLYPVLLRTVSSSSPPAKVLAQYQPKIKEIDGEIQRAQDALRRLIASNTQSEEERLEWTRESEEATVDAQDLSVSLVIDLIGARADELAKINDKERAEVLNHLMNRAEEDGQRNSIHSAYGMLLDRKQELERIQNELRFAGKENDLRIKIRDFSVNKDTKPTKENLWDLISQFKKVEDFAGPSKDLLDAAYTIYRQAASLDNLAMIQVNQERTLQAAAALRGYIVRLEAQKQAARSSANIP
jgi:flavin-binding protein dodecin